MYAVIHSGNFAVNLLTLYTRGKGRAVYDKFKLL